MAKNIHTHSTRDNNTTQGSDSGAKDQPVEELKIGQSPPSQTSKPQLIPVDTEADSRSLRLEDIEKLPFHPHLPEKGPMRDFVNESHEQLGLPKSHAWALWLYVTMAHCGHFVFHDDGCVERRLGLNVVLAGDDESRLCRRLAVETFERAGAIEVVTNPAALQLGESLEAYSADIRRVVVHTGDDNLFARWHKTVSKQEISLAELFDADSFNDHLHAKIRAKALPAASVPMLLCCGLKNVLSERKFPFSVFRDGLVVPSFGCHQRQSVSVDQMDALIAILQKSFMDFPEEGYCLSLGQYAKEALQEHLNRSEGRRVNLTSECNHSHYRQAGMVGQICALSAAYAINASLSEGGKPFDGTINKFNMAEAVKAFERLDRHWNAIDHLYDELSRADEVDTVYDLVISNFQNQRDDAVGGLIVNFNQLANAFCHHPSREGQFKTAYLEKNILPAIVASGRAKKLPGKSRRDRKWVFYENDPVIKVLPVYS